MPSVFATSSTGYVVTDDKPARAVAITESALQETTGPSRVDLLRVGGDAHVALGEDGLAEQKYRDGLALAVEFGRADQQYAIVLSLAVLLKGPNGAPYLPADVAWSVAGTNGIPEAIVGGIITLAVGLAVRGAGRTRKSTV